ncbi:MAG: 6-carboxytetrahydropterin synthase QueD [Desulfobacterales bacterium]|jgi:6-pyruvoyltetrahydropterin/6-carboxytetrahydropterin synthase|nr:6-carboxytetrahydropterin synthase QueD [Desulfobacterales bacterium]MDD3080815.1 6-carboxytetrahydropterin synthase QueD [Desulfobacterales bacterium]MDD3950102.1 6-carboxytetrahydropterin synthase QueD [Desulfobacterales bacterium]MDD4463386.1 6-carboxytetrahydropterin synthase QueD [Desulfobacterales bacterium]MDY0376848.1 6-carboxytetrahydropterin synthase QueD [Desulfobacterales bacterium]
MFEVKIASGFAAAHQLKMESEKCESLHGHNWKVEVCVQGNKLNTVGLLMDFGDLKKLVAEIVARMDHKCLNDLDCFKGLNPSSENIARFIAQSLDARIRNETVRVSKVSIWESEDACATYILVGQ